MNVEELKKQRFMRLWQAENRTLSISDVYRDVKVVKVIVEFTFSSAVLRDHSVRKVERNMKPSDKLYLHYECESKDCTSDGFDLTTALRDALSLRTCVKGEMHCTGKEDWKYSGKSGHTCMTTLKYKIEPKFEDARVV